MIQIFWLQNLYSGNEQTRAHLNECSHFASLLAVPSTVVQHYVGGPHLRLEIVIFMVPSFLLTCFCACFLALVLRFKSCWSQLQSNVTTKNTCKLISSELLYFLIFIFGVWALSRLCPEKKPQQNSTFMNLASVLVAYFLPWNPCVHDGRYGSPALPSAHHFLLCPKRSLSSYGKARGCLLHAYLDHGALCSLSSLY